MFSYSAEQFSHDWRYKISQDFKTDSGEPFPYVEGGHREWGSEDYKITLPSEPTAVVVSSDNSLLAVGVEHDIHIFGTEDFKPQQVLKGHISRVDAIAFQPGNANVLVSAATNNHGGSVRADCEVIIWDLPAQKTRPSIDEATIPKISKEASDVVAAGLSKAEAPLTLTDAESGNLSKDIESLVTKLATRHNVAEDAKLPGRLLTSFDTNYFSPSGDKLLYLPGNRPRSNGNVPWEMRVLSMKTRKDLFTLDGHTDAIMWSGFSPDESLIGTSCWDGTMRIWDAQNGNLKFRFETAKQNWTGGFSPDSKLFAGTSGDGTLYLYSMSDGSTLWSRPMNAEWCRHLSWSVDSRMLGIGGRKLGSVFLIDVEQNEILQQRELSTEATKVDEERQRRFLKSYLEVYAIRYVDAGRKLVVFTAGDGGVEVYDLQKQHKWRFARLGTDEDIPHDPPIEPRGMTGYDAAIWEDSRNGKVVMAAVADHDVRIWSVPLDGASAQ
ncbi:hypothetical protein H2202_003503 [Exophiala xenobiotica]|nr:hypothetical protein H2202_003503 [Exophiala xenobiotica]KAK5235494.1 hypothetical protein LTR47_003679 [Exophiala xenobiotica]KAK5248324.1 hypothetical protein LTS06_006644 [Exophiala xenobiotica]KAK5321349.1 hypothetical protein LTR93_006592 [Exophiala xenobiotica]KAK5347863.1 hypothetical protein LTR61_008492 [Exophiala xenobiotica]